MHPTPEELARFVDHAEPRQVAERWSSHVQACDVCAREVARHRESAEVFSAAMRSVDSPPPAITAGVIISRARGRRRYRATAAAAGLVFATAAVAAAMPQSPLRRYLERLFSRPAAVVAVPSVAHPADSASRPQVATTPSGMSFKPLRGASIVFRDTPPAGVIRIRLVDGADLTVTSTGEGRRYALRGDTITIASAGGGTFDVAVPSALPRVSVWAGGRIVFSRSGTAITTDALHDTSGAWVISVTSNSRSIP